MKRVAFWGIFCFAVAAASPQTAPGVWRWDVKTLSDPDAANIDFGSVEKLTISEAASLRMNQPLGRNTMRGVGPEEFQVYWIDAMITAYKPEPDGDYHVLLKSSSRSRTFGVEVIDPDFAPNARRIGTLRRARRQFESIIPNLNTSFRYFQVDPPIRVRITGVGFWDAYHGQHGLTNGFELHPVLSVKER